VVTEAGASIVYYERWREGGDEGLLEQIRAYNEDDCRSTQVLRDWLLRLRPPESQWFTDSALPEPNKSDWINEQELQLLDFHRRAAKP